MNIRLTPNHLLHHTRRLCLATLLFLLNVFLLNGCSPSPERNVIAYLISEQMGTTNLPAPDVPPGAIEGKVLLDNQPIAGVTVLVAERTGRPYSAKSDANGEYQIQHVPPGQYVPAAVGVGLEETIPLSIFSTPLLVTVRSGENALAPVIHLTRHVPMPLPQPLAASVQLSVTASYTSATSFPPGSEADVTSFGYVFNGARIDTLRLYLPRDLSPDAKLPLLFMIYPTHVDGWESVSTAYAAQGFAFVATSPSGVRALDIDSHAQDARVALELALNGALTSHIGDQQAVALGGSFSSAILHRLLRDVNDGNGDNAVAAWVTVGGITNAFSGAQDFYDGKITVPPPYELIIPALGPANLYPRAFLHYSPVYTAEQLPPTLIIHTAIDEIIPINQAMELEAALHQANKPVEVFYYEDVSHYLQIGDDLTESGEEMFWKILAFIDRVSQ